MDHTTARWQLDAISHGTGGGLDEALNRQYQTTLDNKPAAPSGGSGEQTALILLTHANHIAGPQRGSQNAALSPLQTLIAASMLRSQGFDVAFFGLTFDNDIEQAIGQHKPDLVAVCETNFNYLTKMCLLENRKLALEVAQW